MALRITAICGAAAIAACTAGASSHAADKGDVPLTLTGCVMAGEKDDTFLLTNVQIDGTTEAPVRAFYRFNTTKGLKAYVGRRVEVKGHADLHDVDEGNVKVRTDGDGRVTTEITSERQTIEVEERVFGTAGATRVDAEVPTYKFEVDSVKPLAGNCASAGAAR